MASVLTVRKLPDHVQEALRLRAAAAGRSVEAEVRAILAEVCRPEPRDDWWEGLAERAKARTLALGDPPRSEDIVREMRDRIPGER